MLPDVPDVFILVGPTASGKSAVAYELARRLGGEIISADSMQVYRGVPLLTAQPPVAWQQHIPHHFIACRDVQEEWSAADFRAAALRVIEEVHARGHVPCIVGGTGLYIRALLDGLCEAPAAQPDIRHYLTDEVARHGAVALHARLIKVDPIAAARIHPHDVRRTIRALEVHIATGEPLSARWGHAAQTPLPWRCVMVGLQQPRQALYTVINARVETLFAAGVVDEVRQAQSVSFSRTASQMLGWSLLRQHVAGTIALDATMAQMQQLTRQYAKRQLTWFRRDARIQWLDTADADPVTLAQQIQQQYVDVQHVH